MAILPTSAQVTDSGVTNAQQKTYFGNMLDFLLALLGSDSSDTPAARAALGVAPRATRIDVASVTGTVNLTTSAPNTDDIRITGALAITGFTVAIGRVIRVTAGGAFSLANNANIVTQTGATLQFAANDTFSLRATAANVVEVLMPARPLFSPLGTAQATTSGTSKDFTLSVSNPTEVSLNFQDVSTNGTNNWLIQAIVAGAPVTTGYRAIGLRTSASTTAELAFTAGFGINGVSAALSLSGTLTMKLLDKATNTWSMSGTLGDVGNPTIYFVNGSIVLAAPLEGLRLTTVGAVNTFDAGSANTLSRQ